MGEFAAAGACGGKAELGGDVARYGFVSAGAGLKAVLSSNGVSDDDEAMTERRLLQANLIGPAGYISMEDGAAPGFVQRGVESAKDELSVVEMGGASVASDESRVTEAAVRGFWKAYRAHMGL